MRLPLLVFAGLTLAVTLAPCAAAPLEAPGEEFKLVLTPEPGQAPPARVCLASRNAGMKALRSTAGHLASLDADVTCRGADCLLAARPPRGRCARCPIEGHPDCRARLDPGDWPPADYTVVCADDASARAGGGTIFVAVESVEAENPPEFHSFEVSGGRVRWSPVRDIRRPSYRVLGGDFESSRLSYPRRPTDRPWAEVPIRRRCRCLDAQLPVGLDAVRAVQIDGAPVCRGSVGAGDLLPIEVPATARGRVRGLGIESGHARLEMAWGGRWPAAPLAPIPTRVDFGWRVPCAWPGGARCPAVRVRGARCRSTGRVDGVCRYRCSARSPGALVAPIDVDFTLDTPPLRWRDAISAPGDVSSTDVPDAQRVVWADVSAWPRAVPGDRIDAVRIQQPDGSAHTMALSADAERIWIATPGARCGLSLGVTPRGERDYLTRQAAVGEGGRLAIEPPAQQVVPWDLHLGLDGGAGWLAFPSEQGAQLQTQLTGFAALGLRLRAPGRRWFGDARIVGGAISDWAYGALGSGGDGWLTRTAPLGLLGAELTAGYSLLVERTALHLFVGGGPTMALALRDQDVGRLPHGRWLGSAVLGGQWPIRAELSTYAHVRVTLRYVFGGVVRRFETNFVNRSVERSDAAGLILLTGGLDLGL